MFNLRNVPKRNEANQLPRVHGDEFEFLVSFDENTKPKEFSIYADTWPRQSANLKMERKNVSLL